MCKIKSGTVLMVCLGVFLGWLLCSTLIHRFDTDLFIFLSMILAMLTTSLYWFAVTKNKIAGVSAGLLVVGPLVYYVLRSYLTGLTRFAVMAAPILIAFACLVIAGGQVLPAKIEND